MDVLIKFGVFKGCDILMCLILGLDCVGVVKVKCELIFVLLDEWSDVFFMMDYDI